MTSDHGRVLIALGLVGALLGHACARRQHAEVEPFVARAQDTGFRLGDLQQRGQSLLHAIDVPDR